MKAQLVTLLIVLFTQSVFAQSGSVTLKGKAVQYAGLELTIQYVSNFITGETEKPGVMKVDDKEVRVCISVGLVYSFLC